MDWYVTQLCLILCDPVDYPVHGILQARVLEWVAFSFSRGSSYTEREKIFSDSVIDNRINTQNIQTDII